LQELRAESHATALDQSFILGSAVDKRDDKAIRRTVSGLIKLVHPDGRYTSEDVEPLLKLALEGRRRVKEQLKRLGGLEFWNTSFTYGPRESGRSQQEVLLPERVEERFLSNATLPPGRLYCVGRDRRNRRTCVFRVEVERIKGTGKCQLASPNRGDVADALRIAYDQVKKHLTELGIKDSLAQWDLRVQVANPMEADEPSLMGIPVYVAIVSALLGRGIETGTIVSGEMSVQGNLEGIDAVGEIIMIAREYGAVQIALPSLSELDVSNVPVDLTKNIGIMYYQQPRDLVDLVLTKPGTRRVISTWDDAPDSIVSDRDAG
jgi:ATP-dependent Lon protease